MARVEWSGKRQVRDNMRLYAQRVRFAVGQLAQYFAAVLEKDAKENAPWTDRTANARQALRGYTSENPAAGYPTEQLARDVVAIYLSHGMDYGVFLELKNQGQYAVIIPTLETHYGEIQRRLKELFK